MKRGQVFKDGRACLFFGRPAVDRFHLHEGEVFLSLNRQADGTFDDQAGAESQAANLAG